MALKRALFLLTLVTFSCGGDELDVNGLPSIEGYTGWTRRDVHGFAPGHRDTYRVIYTNPIADDWGGAGPFPEGAVIVKEVRDRLDPPGPGDLRYLAIMRKLPTAPGITVEGGWVFTTGDGEGGEARTTTCYSSCHRQAPNDSTFLGTGP